MGAVRGGAGLPWAAACPGGSCGGNRPRRAGGCAGASAWGGEPGTFPWCGIVAARGGTGAPRLPRGDPGGFVVAEDFAQSWVQESSVGVRGGDSGLVAFPGAAAAPRAVSQPCFPLWKMTLFLEASSCERELLDTNLWHPQAAAFTTWDPRRRRSAR